MLQTKEKKSGHRISLYLDASLYMALSQEAKARRLSLGKIVKERLLAKSGKKSSPTGFTLFADLIGQSGGEGPVDLSTNPVYLGDYGKTKPRRKTRPTKK
jgi:hypothetical protein